jgi:hypothetical protein
MSGAAVIPFEKQSDLRTNRSCGAACLSMVYRSLGQEVAQAEIWPVIAKENRFGNISSTTHLMAKDALSRGFAALAYQPRHPLLSLRLCCDLGVRAILNHRLGPELPTGHYTVLVDIDDKQVVLHDPFYGPSRPLSHAELLDLWQPNFPGSEIVGYILIAVAPLSSVVSVCDLCRTPIPASVECPRCKNPVNLQPGPLLRCVTRSCIARTWNYICCPSCDYTWTFSLQAPGAGASTSESPGGAALSVQRAPAVPASAEDIWKLSPLFGELDKFINHVLSLPIAANNPDIKRQLDFIIASKEKLKLAQAEELVHRKTHQEQLRKIQGPAMQREEAHRMKMEELNRPSPPLDAKALGRALLKNLGWGE